MFMFWSKRAVLTRRLLKAKVRGEHETECETQEDTFSRINSTITNNGTSQQQQQQRQQQLRQQQQQIQQQQNTTSRGHNHRSSTSSSTNRVNSVANRFHQGCCGGDLSHDEDDDTEKNNHQHHQQQQQQQQSRIQPNRLTRCKDLLKTLKENQLEMLLNVVESYGSDFGSCVLVPRKQTPSPGRSSPVESRRRSASPGLPKQQDSMSQCNRHQRCGLASTLHENPTRRVSHRHLLRSRRHNPPGARCSRCVSCHTIGNEELQLQQQQQQQRVTTGNTGCNREEFPTSTNDDDFTVTENRDNEMNLRIVDTTKRSNTGQANDDPRQEQPAWSAGEESNATINGNNMTPVGSTCCKGQRLNEEGVSRPERDRCRRNHGGKMGRTTGRRRRDEANMGDNSSGSETSGDSPLDDPHLLSCQIWRWPDLANSSELKKLPVCHSAKDPVYVCCNPYHWSRLCKPESPPPPYCLIPDRLRPEDRAPSEISGDYRRCGITTSPQHHSLTTNGEGGAEMGQKEWCTLAYWELGGRVGRLYPVEPSTVNVFDSLHDGDGLCLATLAENHVASLAVQRTRSKIGLGLMLSQESDGVWAYNRSESPIFVNSPTLDDPESRTLLVYRVPPGFCLNIFDRAKTYQLPRCHGQGSPTSGSFNSGPVDVNSVRISFAKGWGPKYSRQEVTSCPCWLEVLLAPCR